jgi:outer membrane protein assembly factor BamB
MACLHEAYYKGGKRMISDRNGVCDMCSSSDSELSTSWATFKGNIMRTGRSEFPFLRKPSFRFMIKLGPILSSPVFDKKAVYVSTITGRIYRIESSNMAIGWHVNASSPIVSTPSIHNGRLIVGTFSTWINARTTAFEPSKITAYDLQDGTKDWEFELKAGVFSSICSVRDIHIFGCMDGMVYALDREGDLKWQFETDGEVWCSPSSDGVRIFVGSDDGSLYAFDLDGDLVWKTKLSGKIRSSSPCLSNEAHDNLPGSLYIGTQSGLLYRINKDNGSILWALELGSPVLSSPSLLRKQVVVGSSDGYLYCVKCKDGSLDWKFKTGGKIWSSPIVVDEHRAFVGSLDSHIYCVDFASRNLVWKFPTMGMIDSSPCVTSGMLFVGSRDGYLYVFDRGDMIPYIR